MSDHPDIETLVAQWEQYLSRAESDGDTWTGVAHTDLRLFIAAWRAEKGRADALLRSFLQAKDSNDFNYAKRQEAEARATQAEQRIADYQDAVCQRDEIIAENKARLTQAEQQLAETESNYQRMIAAVLECNPRGASECCDDQLEPPWDVVRRVKAERDALTRALAEARSQADLFQLRAYENNVRVLERMTECDQLRAERDALARKLAEAEARATELDDAVTEALKDRDYYSDRLEQVEKQRDGNEQAYLAWRREADRLAPELGAARDALDTAARWLRGEPVTLQEPSGPRVVSLGDVQRIDAFLQRALAKED